MSLIEIENLTFGFGSKVIFQNASAQIKAESITGLIGPNGSGKTTLLKLVCNELNRIDGVKSRELTPDCIGLMGQEVILPDLMKVEEVVQLILTLNRARFRSYDALVASWPEQEQRRFSNLVGRLCKGCSVGERKWLFLRTLLSLERKLYLLDEPTAGVDPTYRAVLWGLISDARDQGKAFVVSSHLLDELADHSSDLLFVNRKALHHFGTPEEFMASEDARNLDEAFLKALSG